MEKSPTPNPRVLDKMEQGIPFDNPIENEVGPEKTQLLSKWYLIRVPIVQNSQFKPDEKSINILEKKRKKKSESFSDSNTLIRLKSPRKTK